MFNKPLQRKLRTSTQTQLQQHAISIQLAKKLNLLLRHRNYGNGGYTPSDKVGGWGGGAVIQILR